MNALTGFRWSDWTRLLKEVKFSIDRQYFGRFSQVTMFSLMNSWYYRNEKRSYQSEIAKATIEQPIFILGHWRNGTTLVHELFARDPQFAYPNLFEVSRPFTFLTREPVVEKMAGDAGPTSRPMDNMQVTYRSPGEDEAGIAVLCLRSPAIAWMFPRYEAYYDRFLTFEHAEVKDAQRWQLALDLFMRKLTVRYHRPLVMKSPTHTARIKLILELYPDARFIHIHRNPFIVFQSTMKLYNTAVAGAYLQNPKDGSVVSGILRRYKDMYDAYFLQRDLISAGNLVDVQFEELEKDPIQHMKVIYEKLSLPGFQEALPKFQQYTEQVSDYKKNTHKPIAEPLRQEIAANWQRCFDEWGYTTNPIEKG